MTTLTVAGRVPQWTMGDRLRKARESAGMNQSQLEQVTGISRRTITAYEGGVRSPRRPQLIAWAMATGVPLWWLAGTTPDGEDGLPRLDSNQQPSGYTLTLVTTSHRTDDGAEVAA